MRLFDTREEAHHHFPSRTEPTISQCDFTMENQRKYYVQLWDLRSGPIGLWSSATILATLGFSAITFSYLRATEKLQISGIAIWMLQLQWAHNSAGDTSKSKTALQKRSNKPCKWDCCCVTVSDIKLQTKTPKRWILGRILLFAIVVLCGVLVLPDGLPVDFYAEAGGIGQI